MKNIFYIIGLALLVFAIFQIKDLSNQSSGNVLHSNQLVVVS